MGGIELGSGRYIEFRKETHQYFDPDDREYGSVTRLLNIIEPPFDAKGISLAMAKKSQKEGDQRQIEVIQAEILGDWEKKRISSEDRGNWIHSELENYHKFGRVDYKLENVAKQIRPLYEQYWKVLSEVIVFDIESKIAGQVDKVVRRQKSATSIHDFYDYKTNEAKGIEFDSVGRKTDDWKHYNRYFLPPLDHLEACNYNRYSLQLSLYARLAEKTYGTKIGRLAIIYIDNDLQVHTYPVPYLRFEADALLEASRKLKPLPEQAGSAEPVQGILQPDDNDSGGWDDDEEDW